MRAIVLTLALVTSPVGPAVCEVVCADHVTTGHHRAPAPEAVAIEHHHEDAAAAVVAPSGGTDVPPSVLNSGALSSPVDHCAPVSGQLAILRSMAMAGAFAPPTGPAAQATLQFDLISRQSVGGRPPWSFPPPPLLASIPLRI